MEIENKQPYLNMNNLRNALKDFIDDSRQNIDNKTNTINLVLQIMKEENEQLISKSKIDFLIYIIFLKISSYIFRK